MTQEKNTSLNESSRVRGRQSWVPRFLAIAVGLVLLVAGVLKAVDLELFIRQIKAYGIIQERPLIVVSAWGLIVLECGLGAALIVLYRPRIIFPLTAFLFLIFTGATGWAWFTGATQDCGCYGAWLQHTPGQALIENLVLLGAAVLAWMGCRRMQAPQTRIKAWAVTIACLMGLAMPVAFGLPTSGVKQAESKPPKFDPIQVHGLGDVDLNIGGYLIVLMGTDCLHCQEAIPELNMLVENPDLPMLIALCTSKEADCVSFTEEFLPVFPIGHISDDLFWHLLADGDMPRTILLEDGHIRQVWDQTVPTKDDIQAAYSMQENPSP
ncbi:MAG: hypothetical protein JRI70_06990 [Deltaproteobacteria bacterium]|nr:hypothetical protein [Deltaproteobacteria bacterium]MBW2171348.1 hypothetical protein [Deltaproteobacteria bacterium]